jgi:hypothetical protein
VSERTPAELAADVRTGASFYMAHRMVERPHENDPEITMASHVPNGEACPGCRGEAALAELQSIAEQAEWHKETKQALLDAHTQAVREAARYQEQAETLRERLGCAVEELERRCPLDADPLTAAIIADGRAALAASSAGQA